MVFQTPDSKISHTLIIHVPIGYIKRKEAKHVKMV